MTSNPWESDEALKASLKGARTASRDATIGSRGTWVDQLHATARSNPRLSGMRTMHASMRGFLQGQDPSLVSVDRLETNRFPNK